MKYCELPNTTLIGSLVYASDSSTDTYCYTYTNMLYILKFNKFIL